MELLVSQEHLLLFNFWRKKKTKNYTLKHFPVKKIYKKKIIFDIVYCYHQTGMSFVWNIVFYCKYFDNKQNLKQNSYQLCKCGKKKMD